MKFLYVSSVCSEAKFKEIFEKSKIKPQQQAQKFHTLLSNGLSHYAKNIEFLSRPPINRSTNMDINLLGKEEVFGNRTYHYLKVSNNPLDKHIGLFFSSLIKAIRWGFKNKTEEKIIICDILNLSISISALISSKLCRIKSVAIITDLPNYMNYKRQKKSILKGIHSGLYRGVCNYFIEKFDNYIILTEQMNELINPNNKPYVVIEGMVDIKMKSVPNKLENKYKEKVIIYAGALYEKYGIKLLIEAFTKIKEDDARLWLFGDGELVKEIKSYEKIDSRIKFFGIVPNEEVVREQLKATLLVNPRPSIEEFTKYSFPSKNMEYMVSGTPVLTTPLQGMPKKYYNYIYLFENQTVDGMSETLSSVIGKNNKELHDKGQKAKEFVLREKNNFTQVQKIIMQLWSIGIYK